MGGKGIVLFLAIRHMVDYDSKYWKSYEALARKTKTDRKFS